MPGQSEIPVEGTPRPPTIDIQELRHLATQISNAVEEYAQGKTESPNEIVKQCHTLHHRAESPEDFAERLRYQPVGLCALLTAAEAGILQPIASNKEATAAQLAEITKRPQLQIIRVLRLLTAIGVCDEVGVQHYRANNKTALVASKGQMGGIRASGVPVSGLSTKLEEYLSKSANGTLSNPNQTAFEYSYGKPMYEMIRESATWRANFDNHMESKKQELKQRWHQVYPIMSTLSAISAKGDGSPLTIVDVGGSRGHDLESFHSAHPEFNGRLVLQDLPEAVAQLEGEKIVFEAMPYDFFTPQPIQGAAIYLLLAVLHNWSDDSCRVILKNLADAMQNGYSRLLISGVLLPEVGAPRRAAELDLQMWWLQLGMHRTRSQLENLVNSAGLGIVEVYDNAGREAIIELSKQ